MNQKQLFSTINIQDQKKLSMEGLQSSANQDRQLKLEILYLKHRKPGDDMYNKLLLRYLKRAKESGLEKIPKNLAECEICLEVFSSKLMKNHIRYCSKGTSEKRYKIKSQSDFKCTICKSVLQDVNNYQQFYKHLSTHSEKEVNDAGFHQNQIKFAGPASISQETQTSLSFAVEEIQKLKDRADKYSSDTQAPHEIKKQPTPYKHGLHFHTNLLKFESPLTITPTPSAIEYFNSGFDIELRTIMEECKRLGRLDVRDSNNIYTPDTKGFRLVTYSKADLYSSSYQQEVFKFEFKIQKYLLTNRLKEILIFDKLIVQPNFTHFAYNSTLTSLRDYLMVFRPQKQYLEVLSKLCHAVMQLHKHEIIHRDLKPANIFIDTHNGNMVLIGNLQLAVPENENHSIREPPKSLYRNTLSKWRVGSYCHDSWALGVVILETILGTAFFHQTHSNIRQVEETASEFTKRAGVEPHLKQIISGTILKKDDLMSALEILDLLLLAAH